MVVGEIAQAVDLLVVGAGPAGYAAALRGAQRGRDVTLVDADGDAGVGGVCLRAGCIPSKALIELAETVHGAASTPGLAVGDTAVDLPAFQQHKQQVVDQLTNAVRSLLSEAAVRVRTGTLRFTRPDQAAIQGPDGRPSFVEFRDVVVATGSRPAALPGLTPDGTRRLGRPSTPSRAHSGRG